MMIKQKVFHYYQDAGHGWLKVSRELLERMRILDKVSSYSYQKNDWVYLEEDCDMSLFLSKYMDLTSGVVPGIREHHCDYSSIRGFLTFTLKKPLMSKSWRLTVIGKGSRDYHWDKKYSYDTVHAYFTKSCGQDEFTLEIVK